MKHTIGITLVDPVKQYSSVRTYRAIEYDDGEMSHEDAWKLLEDAAFHQQGVALNRAKVNMIDVKAVNAKFKRQGSDLDDAMGTITDQTNPKVVAKETFEDFGELLWWVGKQLVGHRAQDGQAGWIFKNQRGDQDAQRLVDALAKRYEMKKAPIEVYCGKLKYRVQVEGDFLRRTPVNGK